MMKHEPSAERGYAGPAVNEDEPAGQCLYDTLRAAGVDVTRDDINSVAGHPVQAAIPLLLARLTVHSGEYLEKWGAAVYADYLTRFKAQTRRGFFFRK